MAARKKPELLIPASSLDVLKTAVTYGADAVYIGGEAFGLRAKAKNFSKEDMAEGIAFAHAHDVKVYVTANILAHNDDLDGVRAYFRELKTIGPDALIISDPGVFMIAKSELSCGNNTLCAKLMPEIKCSIIAIVSLGTDMKLHLWKLTLCNHKNARIRNDKCIWSNSL